MRETEMHQAFSKWLNAQGIPFRHDRTDKATRTKKGEPDFLISYRGRCLFIEFKVLGGKISKDQETRIFELRDAQNPVRIVFSLEEAVCAVETWLNT